MDHRPLSVIEADLDLARARASLAGRPAAAEAAVLEAEYDAAHAAVHAPRSTTPPATGGSKASAPSTRKASARTRKTK